MNRHSLVFSLLLAAAAPLAAQQGSQSNPYEGVSNPPPDDTIVTMMPVTPKPKPSPAHSAAASATTAANVPVPAMTAAPAASTMQGTPQPALANNAPVPGQPQGTPQPTSVDPSLNYPPPAMGDGTDDGIVMVEPRQGAAPAPALQQRAYASDPDGDIVHPGPLPPGELGEGAKIRAHLLVRLSTATSESGDPFRAQVASDVLQNGQVLIPAGSEIDGTVVQVSSGHFGGHGSMHLRPDTVILPDGSRYRLYAQVMGAPDARAQVNAEGTITPGSRMKKDGIEYGGAVGGGVVAGSFMGGPAGALAGGLVGAGVITTHLLLDHPQATLEPGTTLVFALTQPLNLVPAASNGN